MAALQGLDVAIRNQVNRDLIDTVDTAHTTVAMLRGLDSYYGQKGKRFAEESLEGAALQVNFRTGLPNVQGVNAMDPNYEATRLPLRKGMKISAGTMKPSSYIFQETVEKYLVNRFKGAGSKVEYVKETAQAIRDAILKLISSDMFPSTTLAPTLAGGADGQPRPDKIMALAYPLQTGYVDNAATGTGTYPVLDIDINASGFTGLKAVNSGTTSSGFGNPTLSNLRTGLFMPQTKNGATIGDLVILPSGPYNYCIAQPEAKLLIDQMENFNFGGEFVHMGKRFFMLEFALDDLAASNGLEAYSLVSEDWRFSFQGGMPEGSLNLMEVQGAPHLQSAEGYIEALLMCRNPRRQGRAYKVTYS